ncbi:MAG: hypothetical protein ACXIVF_04455 [Rhizobiaceae bacterium]
MTRAIRTLGLAARHDFLIQVTCIACRHDARFLAGDLAGLYGEGRSISSLRFKCSQCLGTDCKAVPFRQESSRKREMIVWRPVKVKAS